MNYLRLYNRIITSAVFKNRVKGDGNYYEEHHILPKKLYPQFRLDADNLVLLTAKEHYLCHYLLTKIMPDSIKMQHAFWRMSNGGNPKNRYKPKSTLYEVARVQHAKNMSEREVSQLTKDACAERNRNRIWSKEARKALSDAGKLRVGDKNGMFGHNHTEESKELMRQAALGRVVSEETRRKQSERQLGIKCTSFIGYKVGVDTDGNVVKFETTKEIKDAGYQPSKVRSAINGNGSRGHNKYRELRWWYEYPSKEQAI